MAEDVLLLDPADPASLDGVAALAMEDPATLLRWVYQNLGRSNQEDLDRDWVAAIHRAAIDCAETGDITELSYALQLSRYPVSVERFLFEKEYLGKAREDIYPEVLDEIRKINNPEGRRIVNPYTEAVFTGGIGSAKSTTALYTVAYQLYVLSCFHNPHATFGLDPSSEILFVFLGMAGHSSSTDYTRFYSMISVSPYFRHTFPFNPRKKTTLDFPHRIQVTPSQDTIGQNVMGGMMDEVNFGAIIQNSKRSIDGGEFNATLTTYNGLARRRKSRFLSNGKAPGILCLVSSKRYPGEFTDVKLAEAKNDPSIYVYDKRVWDVKPRAFSKHTFSVFVGDAVRKACVVDASFRMLPGDEAKMVKVPIDFVKDFQDDLIGAMRDIAGVSTLARYPYFHNVNAVGGAFGTVPSILSLDQTDMVTTQLQFYPKRFRHLQQPRWVHIDLGVTSDAAGIACGFVPGFRETADSVGPQPLIEFDFILRVPPPPNGEIVFHKIRHLLVLLKQSGLPIKWVSFDSFQSVDSIQLLRQAGFAAGKVSMDKTSDPYAVTKTAFYSDRVKAPTSPRTLTELISLEKDSKTGKIDHPATGSKDCADAVAGVVYGLSTRREIWTMHNVQFSTTLQNMKEVPTNDNPPE